MKLGDEIAVVTTNEVTGQTTKAGSVQKRHKSRRLVRIKGDKFPSYSTLLTHLETDPTIHSLPESRKCKSKELSAAPFFSPESR